MFDWYPLLALYALRCFVGIVCRFKEALWFGAKHVGSLTFLPNFSFILPGLGFTKNNKVYLWSREFWICMPECRKIEYICYSDLSLTVRLYELVMFSCTVWSSLILPTPFAVRNSGGRYWLYHVIREMAVTWNFFCQVWRSLFTSQRIDAMACWREWISICLCCIAWSFIGSIHFSYCKITMQNRALLHVRVTPLSSPNISWKLLVESRHVHCTAIASPCWLWTMAETVQNTFNCIFSWNKKKRIKIVFVTSLVSRRTFVAPPHVICMMWHVQEYFNNLISQRIDVGVETSAGPESCCITIPKSMRRVCGGGERV